MKTIILSSSLSEESKSFILCKEVEKALKQKSVQVTLVDARTVNIVPTHRQRTDDMEKLTAQILEADNIIFGMGVHNYSINDNLKLLLDTCVAKENVGKFFGILCAAGGLNSYLCTQHLTTICMNEWRMIQLPRIVYSTGKDFEGSEITNPDIRKRLELFVDEFYTIGTKLLAK